MSIVLDCLKMHAAGVILATACALPSFAMVGVTPDGTQPLALIVQYKSAALAPHASAAALPVGVSSVAELERIKPGLRIIKYSSEAALQNALAAFQADPNVEVHRSPQATIAYTPNDPLWPQQWGAKMIGLDKANDTETGAGNVLILDVDTAFDCTANPDLAPNCRQDLSQNYLPSDTTYHGHGYWTAGIANAVANNSLYMAGVASTAKIAFARAFDHNGNGNYADAITAWNAALELQAEGWNVVVNNSWTGTVADSSLEAAAAALAKANILNIAAAGNDSDDNCSVPHYPAVYPGVISVAANDSRGVLASFSDYGACSWGSGGVPLMAPGVNIVGLCIPGANFCNNAYTVTASGTSASTPHVTGAAALVESQTPGITPAAFMALMNQASQAPPATTLTGNVLSLPAMLPNPRPHFVLSTVCTPSPAVISQGGTVSCNVSTTPAGNISGNVALQCSGVTGAVCTLSPTSVPVGQAAALTLATNTSTSVGNFVMTVSGVLGSETETAVVPITVNPFGQVTLNYSNTTQVPFSRQWVGNKRVTITPVTSTIAASDKYTVQHLSGSVDIAFSGNSITATLTSPAGTVYPITLPGLNSVKKNVPFSTDVFDGQSLVGNWVLTIQVDAGDLFPGLLYDWNLSAVAVPAN